jgi:hypothetical protein
VARGSFLGRRRALPVVPYYTFTLEIDVGYMCPAEPTVVTANATTGPFQQAELVRRMADQLALI